MSDETDVDGCVTINIGTWNKLAADVDQARSYLYKGRPVAAYIEIKSVLDRMEEEVGQR
jgi:hypothetical protein